MTKSPIIAESGVDMEDNIHFQISQSVRLTCHHGSVSMNGVVDGEAQRVDTGTVAGIVVSVSVDTGGGIGGVMPLVAFTSNWLIQVVRAVVDYQMQCHHTVCPVYVSEPLHIISAGGIYGVVPLVGFASHI